MNSLNQVNAIASSFHRGRRDVYRKGIHIATVWNTDSDRPTALFIDMGKVSRDESERVMASLQADYGNRLRWVANPSLW